MAAMSPAKPGFGLGEGFDLVVAVNDVCMYCCSTITTDKLESDRRNANKQQTTSKQQKNQQLRCHRQFREPCGANDFFKRLLVERALEFDASLKRRRVEPLLCAGNQFHQESCCPTCRMREHVTGLRSLARSRSDEQLDQVAHLGREQLFVVDALKERFLDVWR